MSRIRAKIDEKGPRLREREAFFQRAISLAAELNVSESAYLGESSMFAAHGGRLLLIGKPIGDMAPYYEEPEATLEMIDNGKYRVAPKPFRLAPNMQQAEELFIEKAAEIFADDIEDHDA